ncbi:hypothetical protein [Pseudomonas piscis]|uniref:hypothetical protein n=1 Tax=Pseudomonas piscis TaxID=2614538 RepID=UPI0003B61B94|nr:hypothetical protein [Pseudomonas piscis]ERO64811.1 hypothetical protein P308_22315 [Pseudomonas piscis]
MNDKGLYPRAHSTLNRIKDNAWLSSPSSQEFREPRPPQSRLSSLLKRLSRLALAAALLAGLVTWGLHSRFGLLLLLLLR